MMDVKWFLRVCGGKLSKSLLQKEILYLDY